MIQTAPIPFKPPRLVGFSERAMSTHYEQIYGTAVRELNAACDEMSTQRDGSTSNMSALNDKVHQATNAVVLHEVYFDGLGGADGLGGEAGEPPDDLVRALTRDFGSIDRWREEIRAAAQTLESRNGWIVLMWSNRLNRLTLQTVVGDDVKLVDAAPIIAIDLHTHAYQDDFGHDLDAYLNTWFKNLHWDRPAKRLAQAQSVDPSSRHADLKLVPTLLAEALRAKRERAEDVVLLDVCLPSDLPSRTDKLPDAVCVRSDELETIIDTLAPEKEIVVYCMYGYQVSEQAVVALREAGYNAFQLTGGIATWRAIGEATQTYVP